MLPCAQRRVELVRVFGVPGEVVLVVGAVGGVHVDQEVRQPVLPQLQPCAHLRRIGFHVVAVEVEVLRLAAEAHAVRAVLVDAVVRRGILVAVHAEHRDVDQHHMVEQVRDLAGDRDIAQQHQPGVLALDLAGVDAGLQQHHGFVRGARGGRIEGAIATGDRHRHRPAFGRAAESVEMDHARRGPLQPLQISQRVGVAGRGAEMGGFGRGDPVGRARASRMGGRGGNAKQEGQQDAAQAHAGFPVSSRRGSAGEAGSVSGATAPPEMMNAIAWSIVQSVGVSSSSGTTSR